MGQSTDGQISFGVKFPEGFEFPWDEHDDDGDAEEWYRGIFGYKPPFEMFDKAGEWLGGKKAPQEKIDKYFAHQRKWEEANPLPFELVNYCSADCPMWILAVLGTVVTANRGYPKELNTHMFLENVDPGKVKALRDFVDKHIPFLPEDWEHDDDFDVELPIKWWLSSDWC